MWSLGVVITALFVAVAGLCAASTATNASTNLIPAAANGSERHDRLLRPISCSGRSANPGAAADNPATNNQSRAEAGRVLAQASRFGDQFRFAPLSDQPAGMSAIVIHPGSRLPMWSMRQRAISPELRGAVLNSCGQPMIPEKPREVSRGGQNELS